MAAMSTRSRGKCSSVPRGYDVLVARPPRSPHSTVLLTLVLSFSFLGHTACGSSVQRGTLPRTLSDDEFWRLSTDFSEPAGAFAHSDNLVSNEIHFVHTVRMLDRAGGVYIGVGPEQNFSYIARLRPEMAFIIDIRQENRNLHLLYKALFEMSVDRADFVSRLFSRERPRVEPDTNLQELFALYETAKPAGRLYEMNARLVRERLLDAHRFKLSPGDLEWIEHAFRAFYADGPDIHYGRSRPGSSPGPSYRMLMTATDLWGQHRSYLATEEDFTYVKDLHARNMIVPLVGDFAGPHAIPSVGDYIRRHASTVSAFYGSNVEVYLNRRQKAAFCGSLAALPYDSGTRFIGSKDMLPFASKLETCPSGTR
jgi:hypothetical protein